jgi:hypothetical protein
MDRMVKMRTSIVKAEVKFDEVEDEVNLQIEVDVDDAV